MSYKKMFDNWEYAFGWITTAVLVVAVLLAVYLGVATRNQLQDTYYVNSISITGKGEITVVPDIATFTFSVDETSETVDSAQRVATDKINKALQYLRDKGVEDKDLQTAGYNVYPRYEWIQKPCTYEYCPQGFNELVGYQVNQSVTVKVRDITKAGELLSGIGSIGISNVSGLTFTTDDPAVLKEEARKLAIEDAKKQAEELSKNLGVKLVRIVSFSEDSGYYPMYDSYAYGKGMDMGVGAPVSPEIPSGEQTISSVVYIGYEIK